MSFEKVEELQLLLIEEQTSMITSLEGLKTQSIQLLGRIANLEKLANRQIIPELEEAIKALAARANIIDAKVPDSTPAPH